MLHEISLLDIKEQDSQTDRWKFLGPFIPLKRTGEGQMSKDTWEATFEWWRSETKFSSLLFVECGDENNSNFHAYSGS